MDQTQLLIISSIITSLASFILALTAIFNFILVKKQLGITEKQLLLLRNEKIPIINILEIKYDRNNVNLKLENKTDTPALDIYLRTDFIPLFLSKQSRSWSFIFKLRDTLEGNKNEICYPVPAATYVKDKNKKIILGPKTTGEFSTEIGFFVSYTPRGKKSHPLIERTFGRLITFNDLIKLLKDNGIRFCNIDITLKYYDLVKSYSEINSLFSYVLDIEKHKTLADVVKDAIPFQQRPLEKSEFYTMPEDMIMGLKDRRDFLDDSKFNK